MCELGDGCVGLFGILCVVLIGLICYLMLLVENG